MACTRALTLLASFSLAFGAWNTVPNTRCHNDVGQIHHVKSLADCEAAAPSSAVGAVSFCPPSGASDCSTTSPGGPQPGTCWFFPAATACEASAGWATATRPLPSPTPPPPPPPDWAPRIAAGHMAFTTLPPEAIGVGFFPVVGNGFVGLEAGPFIQPFENNWPWRDAGSLKLSGVYSGFNYTSPSHRAQIPRVSGVDIAPVPWATMEPVGAAIDYERAVFLNRTRILTNGTGAARCANGTIVEFALYAHRALRELFVMEVRAFAEGGGGGAWACEVPLSWAISPSTAPWGADVLLAASSPPGAPAAEVWAGTTALPEEPGGPLRSLAVVLDAWAAAAPAALPLSSAAPLRAVRAVLRSDLDVAPGAAPGEVAAAALATWQAYAAEDPVALRSSHEAAWAALWAGGGVELAGNATLAAALNASLYDIVSSLRGDWPWSTSPGGLATGGYSGHSFWDMETWMYPVLVVLFPDLARAATQYRVDRLGASLDNARSLNRTGAQWAWESAATGLWASPWREADFSEIHLDADIPLAQRKLFYATNDTAGLRAAWPLLNATCTFWQCVMTRADTPAGAPPPPGWPAGCAGKGGAGNWTVRHVITPDESSGLVNDSAYTNAAAAETLAWCGEAAALLGEDAPPQWAEMAAAPYLPLNDTLFAGGAVHAQQTGYAGKTINQADVALLQYPLGLDFGAAQNERDLTYYASKTDFSGMFTGDSSYACGFLALGDRAAADAQLALAFGHISDPFFVFTETEISPGAPPSTSGTQHFVTGSGGLLQAFVFGYPGLRIARRGVLSFTAARPVLPPAGVTQVKLRGLHLLGVAFDAVYDGAQFCAALQPGGAPGAPQLELRVLATGQRTPLGAQPVCVPVQPVEVAGFGFA